MGLAIKVRLKKLKQKGKQNLFVIPYFFTFANAVFGLLSVIKTLDGDFVGAAYCILFAGVMDLFDGRLARAFNSVSYLGMELDSLCDAVSFCFAPAILLYSWYFHRLGIMGLVVLSLYLCFGLLRLAKFNILSATQTESRNYFIGLPTTVTAFMVSLLVIHFTWISRVLLPFLQKPFGLAAFIFVLAFLMISPVHFVSFKKISPKLAVLAGFLALIFVILGFAYNIPFLFIGIFSYIISSIMFFLFSKAANR